jgi:carboxypeptidase family protein
MRSLVSVRRIVSIRMRTTLLTLWILLPFTQIQAQVLRGTVKDGDTGAPVADASVVLMDEDGKIVRGTLTELDGSFVLEAPESGDFSVRVGAASYVVQDTPQLRIEDGEEGRVDILLQSEDRSSGPPMGFTQRQARGEGMFITRDQVEERSGDQFTDLFQFTPAVKVVPLPLSGRLVGATSVHGQRSSLSRRSDALLGGATQNLTVRIKAGRDFNQRAVGAVQRGEVAEDCIPVLWVDGIWWGDINQASVYGPNGAIAPGDVEAVEIYNHIAIVPEQFNSGRDSMCGVVVVWTRKTEEN